ncbi:hypothetical protein QTP70_023677 [Hemibagrus guttatus]|uniref:G-protein coupled receptors family 1 profile domain-containing protein n=1 Tax=Hemibagrus guttatus TaxID=175788 RepID=A0AAE0UT76_9TELE|nr:hypothetical protein QTP70_023677 [Hemibagrus guttatus]
MLERFVAEGLGAKDTSVDFLEFLGLFKQLYCQCRSVVASDGTGGVHSVSKVTEEKISSSPTSKAGEPPSHSESLISQKSRAFVASEGFITSRTEPSALRRPLDLGLEDDDEEGDSFFDDPLPKPQKTYGCLSAIGSDTEGDGEDMFSDAENKPSTNPEPRRAGSTKPAGITPSPLSDTPSLKSAEHNQKDPVSNSKEKGLHGLKSLKEKTGSSLPAFYFNMPPSILSADEELDYDDDFNSHNSKSALSISEEIEEASVEGPDFSDRLEEITQDVSVSQTSQAADYMEDVARLLSNVQYQEMNMTIEYDDGWESPCDMNQNLENRKVKYYLQIYVHSIICIVGLIGNVLVILTYAFYKRTKSMTDVYLLNVAIADVLFVVALPLLIFSEQNDWAMGDWSCKLLRGVYSINLYSGILLLACISLDRYMAIVQARRSFRFRSSMLMYSYGICAFVWLLALFLTLPTIIYYERYKPSSRMQMYEINLTSTASTEEPWSTATVPPVSLQEEQHVCFFRFDDDETAKLFKVLVPSSQVAVGFCLPLLVMGFCYSSVVFTLLHAKNFQRHKAVRVVLTVVLVFIICHLPYNAVLLYDIIYMFSSSECSDQNNKQLLLILTESLAYLHCCLNPLLYAFIGVKFRNHFRKVVEDLWCLGKSCIGASRASRVTSEAYLSSRRSVDSTGNENATSFTM